jgi:hypothetical protein
MVIHCASPITHRDNNLQRYNFSTTPVNPYQVLQVRTDATIPEIKQNYRRLSLLHHPGRKALNVDIIQNRAKVFQVLAACYETLVYHREYYDALVHSAPPLKGEILVGGKKMTTFRSQEERVPDLETSSSDEEEEHYTSKDTSQLFPCPLALLFKARHYEPFTNPYDVFGSVFGHDVFCRPNLPQIQWLPTVPTKSAAAEWTESITKAKDGTVVGLTSRTLGDRRVTRRETTTVDPSGQRHVQIEVFSEQIRMVDSQDVVPHNSPCPWYSLCVAARHDDHVAESRDLKSSSLHREEEEEERCYWPEMSLCGGNLFRE